MFCRARTRAGKVSVEGAETASGELNKKNPEAKVRVSRVPEVTRGNRRKMSPPGRGHRASHTGSPCAGERGPRRTRSERVQGMEESAPNTPSVTEERGFTGASLPKPHELVECFLRGDQGSGERAWVQAVVNSLDFSLTPPSVSVKVGSEGRELEIDLDRMRQIATSEQKEGGGVA